MGVDLRQCVAAGSPVGRVGQPDSLPLRSPARVAVLLDRFVRLGVRPVVVARPDHDRRFHHVAIVRRHRLSRVADRGDHIGRHSHPAVRAFDAPGVHGRLDGAGRRAELRCLGGDHSRRSRRSRALLVGRATRDADLPTHRHCTRFHAGADDLDRPFPGARRAVHRSRAVDGWGYGVLRIGRRDIELGLVRGVVPVLDLGVRNDCDDRRAAQWRSRSLHAPDTVACLGRALPRDDRGLGGSVAVHAARHAGYDRHDRDRCAGRIADHRRAAGDVVPLVHVVGSAARQHHEPAAHRGRVARAARRPS